MNLDELLKQRLEKEKVLHSEDYKELGLFGDGYCELDDDDDYYEDDD